MKMYRRNFKSFDLVDHKGFSFLNKFFLSIVILDEKALNPLNLNFVQKKFWNNFFYNAKLSRESKGTNRIKNFNLAKVVDKMYVHGRRKN